MTTINAENAKQIRKPMEVYVRMDLSDKSITMTYSGYSSAKIADGKLDQTNWKMRKITDLQGDGYPLDSSCVLYNPNTTASASNGKIGIRGNIGENVSVTITGSAVMDSATIMVTGASSVSHDGGTSTISGSTVIVSIEASTTTLTFTPKSADRRVEISDIIPGVMFAVTNENMISCTLSLRADLSIVDPTLPESELNLEFYNDEDISETLAAIPEDTPITYRAGYDGDLSPERKFYITDQVTYKDNVISVHAVDAVHFLEYQLPWAIELPVPDEQYHFDSGWEYALYKYLFHFSGLAFSRTGTFGTSASGNTIIDQSMSCRDVIRWTTWTYRKNDRNIEYVDAGIPMLTIFEEKPSKWAVNESDCADVEHVIERSPGGVIINTRIRHETEESANCIVGHVDWYKNGSAFISFDEYVYNYDFSSELYYGIKYLPVTKNGMLYVYTGIQLEGIHAAVCYVTDLPESEAVFYNRNGTEYDLYTQVIPWQPDGLLNWEIMVDAGKIPADTDSVTLDIGGEKEHYEEVLVTSGDISVNPVEIMYDGVWYSESEAIQDALDYRLGMSPRKGSFTWKGDPRMQPRDVFTFVKLDGTEIDCTIEQIDLEHVGGGTTAKITYREGIV